MHSRGRIDLINKTSIKTNVIHYNHMSAINPSAFTTIQGPNSNFVSESRKSPNVTNKKTSKLNHSVPESEKQRGSVETNNLVTRPSVSTEKLAAYGR